MKCLKKKKVETTSWNLVLTRVLRENDDFCEGD